ncbi:MAG: DNA repair protein RecO [Pseudomonadota bacterium]
MQWTEEAILLGHRQHGETSVIVEAMTRQRGRCLGLVRGGRSRRYAAVLQAGNSVDMTWRARLEEHLGTVTLEEKALRGAAMLSNADGLLAMQLCASHLRLLAERDPHPRLYDLLALVLENLSQRETLAPLLARFEVMLLEELGFGLDLETCAGTGANDNLVYVSPKSGRAVSASAGEPYKDKLLPLPGFLRGSVEGVVAADTVAAFRTTGYFLNRDVWEPRGMTPPDVRDSFIARLKKRAG